MPQIPQLTTLIAQHFYSTALSTKLLIANFICSNDLLYKRPSYLVPIHTSKHTAQPLKLMLRLYLLDQHSIATIAKHPYSFIYYFDGMTRTTNQL